MDGERWERWIPKRKDAKGRRRGRDKKGDVIKDMEMGADVKGDEEEENRDELQVRFVTR